MISRLILNALRWWLIVCIVLSQNACLHTGAQKSIQIPQFKSVALVNKGATSELKKRFSPPLEGSSVDTAIVTGTAAGAGAAVAAQASVACAYLVFVCAMLLVPAGALIGAVGGSVADSSNDPMEGLSNEQILALESRFASISQRRTISLDLEENLKRQIPPDQMTDVSEADSLLQFRLYDVRFTKTSFRKYALTLKSVMLFKWGRNGPRPPSTHKVYQYTSDSMTIEDWIQDDDETMNQAFDTCIKGLADEMLKDIQFEGA